MSIVGGAGASLANNKTSMDMGSWLGHDESQTSLPSPDLSSHQRPVTNACKKESGPANSW